MADVAMAAARGDGEQVVAPILARVTGDVLGC